MQPVFAQEFWSAARGKSVLALAWVPAAVLPAARPVLLAADAVLLLAVAFDLARTPHPRRLDLRRTSPARVGLSREFDRVARVALPAAAGLELELREEFPSTFERLEGIVA